MVDKIPTATVQIMSQSDIMRTGQNYKINKKIWELIEEKNTSQEDNSDLEARITSLEERAYDDSEIKEKIGYDNIPEGQSLMSQINDLKNQIYGQEQETTQQEPE